MKKSISILIILFAFLIQDAIAGGFIICKASNQPNPTDRVHYLQVRSLNVNTSIHDATAETTFEQVFYNTSYQRLEGEFLFPIPNGVHIDQFTMWINGKETEAELLDADKARKIYEDIVRSMKDPALLEYAGQDVLKMHIFPIEPNSEQKVKIIYSELLQKDGNTHEYVFPFQFKEEKVGRLGTFTMDISLASSNDIKNIYSPTHQLDISRHGKSEARLSLEEQNFDATTNLRLYFSTSSEAIGMSQLFYKPNQEDGYFMVQLSPGFVNDDTKIASKDITFVVDASGSMSGEKMKQAKEAIKFCLRNLNSKDHFNVIRFSTEARSIFESRKIASQSNIMEAMQFVEGWKAIGGTNIEDALKKALATNGSKSNHMIVFLTDGKPTIGSTDHQQLLNEIKDANQDRTRIFTFGIGTAINTHLLDKITEQTKAYRSYVLPDEDLEIKLSNFYTKVSSPVLSDLKINWGNNVYDVYPKELPDLFKGSSVTIFGRYKSRGTVNLVLAGKLNQASNKFIYNIDFASSNKSNDFVSSLWATRKVAYLVDQVRLNGENDELKDEIKSLALEHGIITPYTSYLIIEDEQDLVQRPNPPRPPIIPLFEPAPDDLQRMHESVSEAEGEQSIRGSRSNQMMKSSDNMGQNKMAMKDQSSGYGVGDQQNLEFTNVITNGRSFYNDGNFWNDANLQKKNWTKERNIDFASKEYFELSKEEEDLGRILALGRNVRFVHNQVLYNIIN